MLCGAGTGGGGKYKGPHGCDSQQLHAQKFCADDTARDVAEGGGNDDGETDVPAEQIEQRADGAQGSDDGYRRGVRLFCGIAEGAVENGHGYHAAPAAEETVDRAYQRPAERHSERRGFLTGMVHAN